MIAIASRNSLLHLLDLRALKSPYSTSKRVAFGKFQRLLNKCFDEKSMLYLCSKPFFAKIRAEFLPDMNLFFLSCSPNTSLSNILVYCLTILTNNWWIKQTKFTWACWKSFIKAWKYKRERHTGWGWFESKIWPSHCSFAAFRCLSPFAAYPFLP